MTTLPILIATDRGNLQATTVAMYPIKTKVGVRHVVMNHMAAPLSIFSGNRLKTQSRTVKFTAAEIKKDLTTLGACPGCDSVLRANKAMAALRNTKLHCMVCGTYLSDKDLVAVKADDDANVPDDDEDEDTVSADSEDDADDAGDDEGDGNGDEDDAEAAANPDDIDAPVIPGDETGDNTDDVLTAEEVEEIDPDAAGDDDATADDDTVAESEDLEDPATEDGEDEEDKPIAVDDTAEACNTMTAKASSYTMDLLTAVGGLQGKKLSLAQITPKLAFLLANDTPVMALRPEDANDTVKPLFDNPDKLGEAFQLAIQQDHFDADAFGAKPITAAIKMDKDIQRRIAQGVSAATASLETDRKRLKARFTEALGIACVALNKNMAAGKTNPVRQVLVDSLKQTGMRGADKIVNAAFNQHGETYLRNIVSYAEELMAKTPEARAALADMVGKSDARAVTDPTQTEEEDTDTANDVAKQLSNDSTAPVVAATLTQMVAAASAGFTPPGKPITVNANMATQAEEYRKILRA